MLKDKLINFKICIDNEWCDKYCELIESNIGREKETSRTRCHHIVPRYYFKSNGLKCDDSSENKVNLLYKDHILAHYYLMLCSYSLEYKADNIWSLRHIFGDNFSEENNIEEINLDLYQSAYEECYKYMYDKRNSLEISVKIMNTCASKLKGIDRRKRNGNPRKSRVNPNAKNKKLSEYAHNRVGEKNSFYGRKHSDEAKEKMSAYRSMGVDMLDYASKDVLMSFKSAKEAGEYLLNKGYTGNKSAATRVLLVCHGGINQHAYGFSWKFTVEV